MRIIPAIDLINGQCVRLRQGAYDAKTVYANDPLEVAQQFADHGVQYLHLVDLDGARTGRLMNQAVLESIARNTDLQIDFGGGVRTTADAESAFNAGAKQITGGSIAVKQPEVFRQWLQDFGAEKIILGADCRNGKIAISGWEEVSGREVVDFIQEYEKDGVQSVVCTDIARDGMLTGPPVKLYQQLLQQTSVELIASGGISSIEDLEVLRELGCTGAIVGRALYEGQITLKQLQELC